MHDQRPANILVACIENLPSASLGVMVGLTAIALTGGCLVREKATSKVLPEDLAWCDVLLLVRGGSPAELRLLREARRAGRKVATYMDDDLERIFPESRSAAYFRSLQRPLGTIQRETDLVLVTSERLMAELAGRHGIRPVLFRQPRPPAIPDEDRLLRDGRRRQRESGRVRIAYFGSVEHAWFLPRLLEEPMKRLRREYGDAVEFLFCGAVPAFADAVGATTMRWEPDLSRWRAAAVAASPDIALAPLVDTPFHRMKYCNKYLEYGSLGAAGIYSSVPPYADVVVDGVTGLLCANDAEAWYAGIRRLIESPDERERLGNAARADVEARFSAAALTPAWLEALSPLLSHRAPLLRPEVVRLRSGLIRELSDATMVFGPGRGIIWLAEKALRKVQKSVAGRLRPR